MRRVPITLLLGLGLIAFCEVFVLMDAARRDWATVPLDGPLPPAVTTIEQLARRVAVNMTAICWVGYLLTFDGLLALLARRRGQPDIASVRARPNRFLIAWLTSIPVWCFFDWINFYFMDAWRYHGLPRSFDKRLLGYFVAFAAISPGMFLAAQWFQHLGMRHLRTGGEAANRSRAWAMLIIPLAILSVSIVLVILNLDVSDARRQALLASTMLLAVPGLLMLAWTRCPFATAFGFGLGFTAWAIFVRDPIGNLALWVGLLFLLDPLNQRMGGPSLIADWLAGRWGRTLALFAGGALCGLCWEFWNYWAIAKWTYHLPFLGGLSEYRYFEMPLLGFLGFLPFAAECWAMLNTIILALQKLRLRLAEPLPDEDAVM